MSQGSEWHGLRKIWIWLILVICSAGAGEARAAPEPGDYDVHNSGWNGLSGFLAIARESGVDVRVPERLDLHGLGAHDGILLLYPERPPPRLDLSAFMADGGRLAIADDFGAGESLLTSFGVTRSAAIAAPPERRLRGNPNLLIAKPRMRHPLSTNVLALVTNHPRVLHHAALDAIFSVDERRGAVVLTGAVGQGRLVALGDPSVLINNMLEFRGNREFARNLVAYLTQGGRLWIVGPETEFTGHVASVAAADPLAVLRTGLQRMSQVRLPDAALRASSLIVLSLLLLAAATALPRASSYARAVTLPAVETVSGYAGRVRYFARSGGNLLGPLLAYKLEFEHALLQALGLKGARAAAPGADAEGARAEVFGAGHAVSLSDLGSAMRAAGHGAELIEQTRALLVELEELSRARDRPPPPPEISARKFHALLSSGDRILTAVGRVRAQERRT